MRNKYFFLKLKTSAHEFTQRRCVCFVVLYHDVTEHKLSLKYLLLNNAPCQIIYFFFFEFVSKQLLDFVQNIDK